MYANHPAAHWQQQHHHHNGPPPAKKPRGNPIITRYPPPPGYKGPAQPQQPYGPQPAWHAPPQPQAYGQHVHPGYQQSAYPGQYYQAAQPQYPGYAPQHHPQAISPPQGSYFPTPVTGWPPASTSPQSSVAGGWSQYPNGSRSGTRRHNSGHYQNGSSPLDGNGDPMPPMDLTAIASGEDLEEAFDGECYFARNPDEINPELSLGLVEWKAPLPTRRALPGTFGEAELEALAPRIPQASDGEAVSEYFTPSKREEAFLSVRQTDTWQEVKDSLIFREFEAICSEIVSISEMFEKYRARLDPLWEEAGRRSPTPELSRSSTPARRESGDAGGMEVDNSNYDGRSLTNSALDDLEQALRPDCPKSVRRTASPTHSRASSTVGSVRSHQPNKISRPKPLPPVRDQQQEDVLAMLGVTGSPKLVYQTPGPAFGPPPSRSGSEAAHSRNNSMSSAQGEPRAPPPPPPPPSLPYDPWRPELEGDTTKRPSSARSHLTTPGSDFEAEPDDEATPKPKLKTNDTSRKRSYADTQAGAADGHDNEDNEATPTQRRKLARVSDT